MENPFKRLTLNASVDEGKRRLVKVLTPGGWIPELIRSGSLSSVGRASLMVDAFLLSPSLLAACSNPKPPISESNPYMVEEARQLGREISAWKLGNGVSMATAFPDIMKAANLLEGKVDPRQYLPQIAVPLGFVPNALDTSAAFTFRAEFDPESTRKIKVVTDDGREYFLPLIKPNSLGSIKLSSAVLSSSIRLPIAAKEASQVVDQPEYCQAYVALLEKAGGHFSLENPDNLPTNQEEFIISIAYAQAHTQFIQEGNAWFDDFVDIGSHIKVGGIAFANWYTDQLNKSFKPTGDEVKAGLNIAGFLQSKNLIVQRQKGGLFTWVSGNPPEIKSPEFLTLFNEYTKRN